LRDGTGRSGRRAAVRCERESVFVFGFAIGRARISARSRAPDLA
jgi:hypothetical protein